MVGHRRSRITHLQTIPSGLRNADVAVDIRIETRSIERFVSPKRSRAQLKGFFCLDRSLYELRCHCYKARSVIASDPYLSITVANETRTTSVIRSLIDRSSCLESEGIVVSSMECHIALSESRSRRQSTHRSSAISSSSVTTTINLQAFQRVEVSIECAGARMTKTIRDVQKNPNFELTPNDTDKSRLLVGRHSFLSRRDRSFIHCAESSSRQSLLASSESFLRSKSSLRHERSGGKSRRH